MLPRPASLAIRNRSQHDPSVIACLLQPALFHDRHINVGIETKGEFTLGMTVDDWWRVKKRELNAMFMGGLERDGFLGSSFKCNTHGPQGIGCCDGQTKQAPQQRGTWRDLRRA